MSWITGINNIDIKKYYKKVEVDTIVDGIETVIDNDVYTKTEIAAIVASENAIDSAELTNFYNKFETAVLLDGKADKTNVYTKTENNDMLNLKANSADVNSALLLKSNVTDVTASLGLKADLTALTNGLSLKADSTALINGLALKYNITDANTALGLKANITDMNSSLLLKSNVVDTNAALSLKSNVTDVTASLGLKADKLTTYTKTENDNQLNLKANSADVSNSLTLKADKLTTYTKTETNNLLNDKVDNQYLIDNYVSNTTVSNLLALEQDVTAFNSAIANYYNKTETDNLVFTEVDGATNIINDQMVSWDAKIQIAGGTERRFNYPVEYRSAFVTGSTDLNVVANSNVIVPAGKIHQYLLDNYVSNQWLIDNYVSNTTVSNLLALEQDVTAFNSAIANYYNKTETDNKITTAVNSIRNYVFQQPITMNIYDYNVSTVIGNCTSNYLVLEHLGYPFYWVTLNIHLVITPNQNYSEICLLLPFDTAIVNPTHNVHHGSLFFEQYVPNPGYVPYFAVNEQVFAVSRQNAGYQRYVYFYRTIRPSENLAGTYLSIYENSTYTISGQITYLANLSGQNNYSLPL